MDVSMVLLVMGLGLVLGGVGESEGSDGFAK